MPRGKGKRQASSMQGLVPTEAELAEARNTLDKSGDRAKREANALASMKYWAENVEEDPVLAKNLLAAKGEERDKYLTSFLVMQGRNKKAKMAEVTTKTVGQLVTERDAKGWRDYEWMCSKVGKLKLDRWIELKVIKGRPDPKTGETTKEMKQYWWDQTTLFEDKFDGSKQDVTAERTGPEAAVEAIKRQSEMLEMANPSSGSDPSKGAANPETLPQIVKAEKPEPAGAVQDLIDNVDSISLKWGIMTADAYSSKRNASAGDVLYQEKYVESLTAWIKNSKKITTLLNCISGGEEYNKVAVPKMIETMQKLEKEHETLMQHAVRFGFKKGLQVKPAGKKRKVMNDCCMTIGGCNGSEIRCRGCIKTYMSSNAIMTTYTLA